MVQTYKEMKWCSLCCISRVTWVPLSCLCSPMTWLRDSSETLPDQDFYGHQGRKRAEISQLRPHCVVPIFVYGGGAPLWALEKVFGVSFWMGLRGCCCACAAHFLYPHCLPHELRADVQDLWVWEVLQQVNAIRDVTLRNLVKKWVVWWKCVISHVMWK